MLKTILIFIYVLHVLHHHLVIHGSDHRLGLLVPGLSAWVVSSVTAPLQAGRYFSHNSCFFEVPVLLLVLQLSRYF